MVGELELRIEPFADESLYSLLFRNAEAYNFTHLALMFPNRASPLYSLNLNYNNKGKWLHALLEKGKQLGIDVDGHLLNQFDPILFGAVPSKDQKQRLYASASTKYCNHCLREQYYHRLRWDINLITVCIDHDCLLMDQCPCCSQRIRLSRLMQRYCLCGHDFAEGERKNSPPEAVMISQMAIQELLLRSHENVTMNDGSVIDAKNYFYLFHLLARLLDHFPGDHPVFSELNLRISKMNYLINNRLKYDQPRDVTMFSVLCAAMHRLIIDPENYFPDVLTTVQEMSAGAGKGFRYQRAALRKLVGFTNITAFLDVYEKLLQEAQDVRKINNREFISISETRLLLNVSRKEVDRLMHAGYLLHVIHGEKQLISRESIDSWQYKRNQLLNTNQVSEIVGLSPQRVREMAQAGFLTPFSGPTVDSYPNWLFEMESINCFLSASFKHAIERGKTQEWLSFRRFYGKLAPFGITLHKTIEMLQQGKFTCKIDKKQPNFKGLYILKSVADAYLQDLSNERIANFGYTVSDVALLLGSTNNWVKRLVEIGDLPVTSQFTNQKGTVSYYFDPDEINKILASFE